MISDTLKASTQPAHESIENSINLAEITKNQEIYPEVLKAFYGYYQPLEAKLYKFKREFSDAGIVLEDRLKTPLIRRDLETLAFTPTEIESIKLCEELPAVTDFYSAMGVLYVIEGSTHGGQIICKGITTTDLFFRAYGDQTQLMWTTFKNVLNNLPQEKETILVGAARETFSTMNKWLGSFGFKAKNKTEGEMGTKMH